jgi:aspartyl/asparaginyl beta-hydroxylase (cupin superfamily)
MLEKLVSRTLFRVLRGMEWLNCRYSVHGDRPFFNPDDFAWTREVEKHTAAIQKELDALLLQVERLPNFQDISPDQGMLTTDARWKTFFFKGYGVACEKNRQRCPHTTQALDLIPEITTAFFSILAPGKELPVHRGPYNGVLRYHLGVRIPVSDDTCAIRVGGVQRSWVEGKSLVFDDTYDHEAWNRTPHWRIVLFVDFLRPLPFVPRMLNKAMMAVIRATPFVQVALRNQARWEASFYG